MPRTVLIAVFMMVLWTTVEAAEPSITCGATLGPGGVYTLTGDLTCPEGVPGLTLLNRATLDLGGYTLSVAGGVLLYVDEITVRNGTVVDCSAAGWCLYNYVYGIGGDEGHNNLLHDLILERVMSICHEEGSAFWPRQWLPCTPLGTAGTRPNGTGSNNLHGAKALLETLS